MANNKTHNASCLLPHVKDKKMKHYLFKIALLLICSNPLFGQPLTENQTNFSCATYLQLTNGNSQNLFFSPFSVQTMLSVIYSGTSGETRTEFERVLQLPSNDFNKNLNLLSAAAKMNKTENITVKSINNIWLANSLSLKEGYAENVANLNGKVSQLDFSKGGEAARQTINQSIEKSTDGKIKDLIASGKINDLTKMIVANAVYFQGNWESQFDRSSSMDGDFWVNNNKAQNVTFMNQRGFYKHADKGDFQVLELPYKGKDASMILFLPTQKEGLATLEKQFNAKMLNKCISDMGKKEVEVYLPRFEMESSVDFATYLEKMGLETAFTEAADFSKMTKEDIHLSSIVHKAFIKTDETGTEAAASTSALFMVKGVAEKIPTFMANHPFFFIIRDNVTGNLLFMGRYMNPIEEKTVFEETPVFSASQSPVKLSEKSGNQFYHVVSSGETLFQIARTYKIDVQSIVENNEISNDNIFSGQKLLIDINKKMDLLSSYANNIPMEYSNSKEIAPAIHTVNKGETLFRIAQKYHLSVEDLKAFNSLERDELAVGQFLRLEKPKTRFILYTVQRGDTLSLIAKKQNKSIKELIESNNLQNDKIFVGQELKVEIQL